MRTSFTIITLLALLIPACDLPENEAELQALDDEAELEDQGEKSANKEEDGSGKPATFDFKVTTKPAAAGCHWKVKWAVAGVYDAPFGTNKKNKYAGDIVGEYCGGPIVGGYAWLQVATSSVPGGVGYMRYDAVTYAY